MKKTETIKEIIHSSINKSFNSDLDDNVPTIVNQIAEDFDLDLRTGIGFIKGFTAAKDYTIWVKEIQKRCKKHMILL